MKSTLALALLLLASCNREEKVEAPTAEEAERLNDAEAMLNELAKEEGPVTEVTDPSNRSE